MKGIFFNKRGFPSMVFGEEAQRRYSEVYGETGGKFGDILNMSPNKIDMLSRLFVYLKEKKESE